MRKRKMEKLLEAGTSPEQIINAVLSLESDAEDDTEESDIDLSSVSTYVLVLQATAATAAGGVVSVLVPLALPVDGRTSLRTLLCCAAVLAFHMRRPLLLPDNARRTLTSRRADNVVFSALRAAPVIWMLALVLESLAHTSSCEQTTYDTGENVKFLLAGMCTLSLILVAAIRTLKPQLSVVPSKQLTMVAFAATVLLGLLPRALEAETAPLLRVLNGWHAAARIARATAFGGLFGTALLATAPKRLTRASVTNMAFVAASASVWTLVVPVALLALAPIQVVCVVAKRVGCVVEDPVTPGEVLQGQTVYKRTSTTGTGGSDGGSDIGLLEDEEVGKSVSAARREQLRKMLQ